MDPHHERVLLATHVTGRIRDDAIVAETVKGLPLNGLRVAQIQGRDGAVEIGQPAWSGADRAHVVQLRRMLGRIPGEGDRAIFPNAQLCILGNRKVEIAKVELARRAGERLQPQRHAGVVRRPYEHRCSVGHPQGAVHVAIERAHDVTPIATARRSDEDVRFVHQPVVLGAPERDLQTVGRERREILVALVRREFADVPAGDVEHDDGRMVGVAGVGRRDPGQRDLAPVRGPRQRHRDIGLGDAPAARRELARLPAGSRREPNMQGRWCGGREICIVADLEIVMTMRDRVLVGRIGGAHKRDSVAVGSP